MIDLPQSQQRPHTGQVRSAKRQRDAVEEDECEVGDQCTAWYFGGDHKHGSGMSTLAPTASSQLQPAAKKQEIAKDAPWWLDWAVADVVCNKQAGVEAHIGTPDDAVCRGKYRGFQTAEETYEAAWKDFSSMTMGCV